MSGQHFPNKAAGCIALLIAVLAMMQGSAHAIDAPIRPAGAGFESLERYEADLRKETARGNGSSRVAQIEQRFGSNPYRIHRLAGDRYLVLLRGSSEVLLCNSDLTVIDRTAAPRGPVGLDLADSGRLYVGGDLSGKIQAYQIDRNGIKPVFTLELPGVVAISDLVVADEYTLFLLDGFDSRLLRLQLNPPGHLTPTAELKSDSRPDFRSDFKLNAYPIGPGARSLQLIEGHLIYNELLTHTLQILPLQRGEPDFAGAIRIRNNGPFWSVAALKTGSGLLIAAGGIENRPLNRLNGEFGYVDSFLYLFRLNKTDDGSFGWVETDRQNPARYAALNLSALGVITPKALAFAQKKGSGLEMLVSGFGGERMARFGVDGTQLKLIETLPVAPGANDIALAGDTGAMTVVLANPLIDEVIRLDLAARRPTARLQPAPELNARRSIESRLGEALFYTTLLAPANLSDGELSRFSCEACHFEGGIDGRVHFSGRKQIYATTRPLHGLADNLPLFSRGGALSLAVMVAAEFRVANQQRQDIFTIHSRQHPWLKALGQVPEEIDPLLQRRAFLKFFTEFEHRPNPWRSLRPTPEAKARRGRKVFQKRCLDCHQPRPATDADSLVSTDQVLFAAQQESHRQFKEPVWAAPLFFKTGITPYVDRAGTRVPTLRRIFRKYPYFTNGSSPDLRHLLQRFRYHGTDVRHNLALSGGAHEPIAWRRLTDEEIDALEAFLRYF